MSEPREWLIRKGSYFYREKWCGYTGSKADAGRYTEAEARKEAAVEPSRMSAIHQDEVPDDAPSNRIAQLERELADTRERSAEWAKSFARKCVEAVALETENSRLQSEYASLLETVTRKVNEKIEAERELAEARAETQRIRVVAGESRVTLIDQLFAAEAERDRLAASRDGYAKAEKARAEEQYRLAAQCDIYKRGLETLASTFYKGDQHQDYAKHVLDAAARAPLQNGEKEG